jgi:DNA-binding NarL/FixJ family response regulator
LPEPEDGGEVAGELLQDDRIDGLLRPVPPSGRRMLKAWAYGETMASIASRMGLTEGAVSQTIKRLLTDLREAHSQEES